MSSFDVRALNSSIKSEVKKYLGTQDGKERAKESISDAMGNGGVKISDITHGAEKFIEILRKKIYDSAGTDYKDGELGQTAVRAAKNIVAKRKPQFVDSDKIIIDLTFGGDLHRDSLVPSLYDGVDNIIAVLNSGYPDDGHAMVRVRGVWANHNAGNKKTLSVPNREGAHFVEEAIDEFMKHYAKKYNVISIKTKNV